MRKGIWRNLPNEVLVLKDSELVTCARLVPFPDNPSLYLGTADMFFDGRHIPINLPALPFREAQELCQRVAQIEVET